MSINIDHLLTKIGEGYSHAQYREEFVTEENIKFVSCPDREGKLFGEDGYKHIGLVEDTKSKSVVITPKIPEDELLRKKMEEDGISNLDN